MKKTKIKYSKKSGLRAFTDSVFDADPTLYKELKNYTGNQNLDKEKAKNIFFHDVQMTQKKEGITKLTIPKAKKIVEKTMNKAAYRSAQELDFDNLLNVLKRDGIAYEEFRKLNRHQKLDYTKLKTEKPKGNGVRKQWRYNNKFTIQLMYVQDEDGNYTEQLVLKRNEAS